MGIVFFLRLRLENHNVSRGWYFLADLPVSILCLILTVVWGTAGQGGGRVSAPFPYRSGICSMGFDRPSWNAIQYIFCLRDGKRKEDLMEWQSENERGLKRETVDEMEVCTARMSHVALHSLSFSTPSSLLLFRTSLSICLSVTPVSLLFTLC